MRDDMAIRRLRALRQAGYKCQVRRDSGAPCGKPASRAEFAECDDDHSAAKLQAVCHGHRDDRA